MKVILLLTILLLAIDDYRCLQKLKRLRPDSTVVTATAVIGNKAVTCYADGGVKVE